MGIQTNTYTVFESSSVKITREGDNKLTMKIYPIPGYGNHYGKSIIVKGDAVEVWRFRYSWDGTGAEVVAEIHDKRFADDIRKAVVDVKNVDDFEKLVYLIERKHSEINEYASKKFDELIDKLVDAAKEIDRIKIIEKLIKDEKRLRELAEEFINYYIAYMLK